MVCSKGVLGWSSPPGKKTCTFTNQIEDTVKKNELGMYTEKTMKFYRSDRR